MNNLLLVFSLLATQAAYSAKAPASYGAEYDKKNSAAGYGAPVSTPNEKDVKAIVENIARFKSMAQQIHDTKTATDVTIQAELRLLVVSFALAHDQLMQAFKIASQLQLLESLKSREHGNFARQVMRDPEFTTLCEQNRRALDRQIPPCMQPLASLSATAQRLVRTMMIAYFPTGAGITYHTLADLGPRTLLEITGLPKELLPIITSYSSHRTLPVRDLIGLIKGVPNFELTYIDNLDGLEAITESQSIMRLAIRGCRGNAITRITAGHLRNMPKLKALDLEGNQLTHFPADILVQCKELEQIILDGNRIEKLDEDFYRAFKGAGKLGSFSALGTFNLATQERLSKEWMAAGKSPNFLYLS